MRALRPHPSRSPIGPAAPGFRRPLTPARSRQGRGEGSGRAAHAGRRRALVLLLAGLLSGCLFGRSGAPPPLPPQQQPEAPTTWPVTLVLRGTPDMNQTNAVVVRVYTLRGASALPQATLPALWADDAAALRGDLVGREELRLLPGEARTVALEVGAEVTHVAVVANLRVATEAGWVHVFPADELWGQEAVVIIGADRLVVGEE